MLADRQINSLLSFSSALAAPRQFLSKRGSTDPHSRRPVAISGWINR